MKNKFSYIFVTAFICTHYKMGTYLLAWLQIYWKAIEIECRLQHCLQSHQDVPNSGQPGFKDTIDSLLL